MALLSKLKAQRSKGCARLCGTRGGGQKLRKWLMRLPRADWLCVHIPHRIYAISALILGLLSPVSQLLSLACNLQKGPRASLLSRVS